METTEIKDSLPAPLPEPYKEPKVYKAPVIVEEPKIEVSEPTEPTKETTELTPSTTIPQAVITEELISEAPHFQATTTSEKPKGVINRVFNRFVGWFTKWFK